MIRKQVNRWLEYLFRLYKDSKETGNHVTEYFKQQALLIGLTVDEVELLKMASPMHAIGKVAIPDHVLLKPGKLNAEEWEIMKSHAVIGYELLRIQIDRFFRQLQLLPGSIMKNGMVVDIPKVWLVKTFHSKVVSWLL